MAGVPREHPEIAAALEPVIASMREKVRARSSVTNTTAPVLRDIDATLVEIHSERTR